MYILSQFLAKLPKIYYGIQVNNYVLSTLFLLINEQFFTVENRKRKCQVNFQVIITTSFLQMNNKYV
jgi:hypothetical protein